MRITFLTTGLSHGGAETQLVRVAEGLKLRGHNLDVVTVRQPGSRILVSTLENAAIDLLTLGLSGRLETFQSARALFTHLTERKPDVLTCFMYHANLLGTVVGRAARVPRIVTSIRTYPFGGALRLTMAAVGHRFDSTVTTNSQLVADRLVSIRVVPSKKMVVVPNAIEVADYAAPEAARRSIRDSLGLTEDSFVLLAIGRAKPNKDYANLLHAVSQAQTKAQVLVAGHIDEEPELEALRRSLGLENLRFLGFREDVPALLAGADAFVLSSSGEGLPNVLLEAHAAGLPVVATDVGGVREVVSHGTSGFVVPARDSPALAHAIRQMTLLDRDSRRTMGEYGRRHVAERFGTRAVLDLWEKVLVRPR